MFNLWTFIIRVSIPQPLQRRVNANPCWAALGILRWCALPRHSIRARVRGWTVSNLLTEVTEVDRQIIWCTSRTADWKAIWRRLRLIQILNPLGCRLRLVFGSTTTWWEHKRAGVSQQSGSPESQTPAIPKALGHTPPKGGNLKRRLSPAWGKIGLFWLHWL